MAVLRHSNEKKAAVVDLSKTTRREPQSFADAVVAATSAEERAGGLLLVGGSSPRDHVLRSAQAALRWDKLASYWSHAAVVVSWPASVTKSGKQALGVEVTASPWRAERQVPERNGVTVFPLERYLDEAAYPNIAFAAVSFEKPKAAKPKPRGKRAADEDGGDPREKLLAAAKDPNTDRMRYPFWNWLATWAAYAYTPETLENPVMQGIPHPGAAFCEYVYEHGGLDLTPGATGTNTCPELLWSSLLYWRPNISQGLATFKVFTLIRDPKCASRETLPVTMDEAFESGPV